MSFVRNDRNDRRRRVIREAAAADSELAVESVRARKRQRLADRSEQDDSIIPIRRDPGYSQAVRKACQQRLVQLIPVRRSTLTIVLISAWSVWGLLLLSHYWFHVRPYSLAQSGVAQLGGDLVSRQASSQQTSQPPLPISYLLHLRSSHGIAHWLGGQLWMLTALAALMIFQLKRHKLDDYRAKYRVWMMLSIAALLSSMDASTSALLLLGKSIDAWALREVGYSGWSLVLATFATLVGMLGLRLCSEIKSAPASLTFWLGGLLAWALSAVVGTGLLKTTWSQSQTDMIVGGAWLGGILSVFLASGIYLRHIYIQAQRRFVIRHGMISEAKRWKMPSLKLRRKPTEFDVEDEPIADPKTSLRQATQFDRFAKNESESNSPEARSNNRNQTPEKTTMAGKNSEKVSDQTKENTSTPPERRKSRLSMSGWKMPALRLPKWKSDPSLGDDYSDVNADTRLRDKGFAEPMAKKPGWFAQRPVADTGVDSAAAKTSAADKSASKTASPSPRSTSPTASDVPDFNEVGAKRKSWWNRRGTSSSDKTKAERPAKANATVNKPSPGTADPVARPKKSWGLLPGRTPKQPDLNPKASPSSTKTADNPTEKKVARKWFGMLDGLKLKPPADATVKTSPNKPTSAPSPSKVVGPSSSSAAKYDPPQPTKSSTPIQVNRTPSYEADDEEDDDQSNRGLSRADRKRLKKQQQENRRAA